MGTTNTSKYLTVPDSDDWAFNGFDFCIELFFRCSKLGVIHRLIQQQGQNTSNSSFSITIAADNKLSFVFDVMSSSYVWTIPTEVELDRMYHFAVSRNSGDIRIFIDGVAQFSPYSLNGGNNSDGNLFIGTDYVSSSYLTGYIDELRISKGAVNSGAARYTGNFTPTTTRFVADAYTKLLLHFDEDFSDSSETNKVVTNNGVVLSTSAAIGSHSALFSGDNTGFISKPVVFYTRADGKPVVFYPKYSLLTYFKTATIAIEKTANVVTSNMSAILQILKQVTQSRILAKPTKSFAKFTPLTQNITVNGMSATGIEATTENVPPQGPTASKNIALITTPTDLTVTNDIETSYTTEVS